MDTMGLENITHEYPEMFRADEHFRLDFPSALQTPGRTTHVFRLIEQCLYVPLWHIQVLPKVIAEDGSCLWIRVLASTAVDALRVLADEWDAERVNILIPDYLSDTGKVLDGSLQHSVRHTQYICSFACLMLSL